MDDKKLSVCFGLDGADFLTIGAALVTTDAVLAIAGAVGIKPHARVVLTVQELYSVSLCIQLAYFTITMPTEETLKSR
ncbi:MAG: hypothetical protein JSS79_15170 [Bacteroidetes bacterium]|nr:hypothetical protein [Bacteroidota bacterium]